MGLLDRLLNNKPAWAYPDNKPQEIGFFSEKHDQPIEIKSRSVPGKSFEVNVHQMTCTCPKFANDRYRYPKWDARRVCPHLHKAIGQLGLDQKMPTVHQLILEHGRKYKYFHRLRSSKGDVAFGFNKDSEMIGVFAHFPGEKVVRTYNLDHEAWADGAAPDHADQILEVMRRVFRME